MSEVQKLSFADTRFSTIGVEDMKDQKKSDSKEFVGNLKNGIWLFGLSSWVFGITDRSIASFADGYLSALDLTQLFTAATFFVAWLFLKPTSRV
ncbi:hypothetical protein NCWK1_1837 [Nostoc cycadae WK-1]|uniref:Uncharacterized protein n=2 Tax=Nostocales TaxID=1161 RepID=A0A2H6LFX9_9NOSO|nr:hypothetical protein NCWK1_1837 [Nostoc cycadae WK-1]